MTFCYHCMTKLDSADLTFCPECGSKQKSHQPQSFEIPIGRKLNNRYIVGESIGEDNYVISYIGYDIKMERKVIIKEVYYRNFFYRNVFENDNDLSVKYDNRIDADMTAQQINQKCILLSDLDSLSNISKVYDWFAENGTSYIICEHVAGNTLYEHINETGGYEWDVFYSLMKPLLESLSVLHERELFHGNIKPTTIKVRKTLDDSYELVLTDFTYSCPDVNIGLSFEAKSPYEPIEQKNFSAPYGDYTDIYSCAAAMYFAVSGQEPMEQFSKNIDDMYPLLKPYRKSQQLPENVYYALKYALQPNYKTRCQTMDTFITRLDTIRKPIVEKTTPTQPKKHPDSNNNPLTAANQADLKSSSSIPEHPVKDVTDYTPQMVTDSSSASSKPAEGFNSYAGNPNNVMKVQSAPQHFDASEKKDVNKKLLIALITVSSVLVVLIIGAVIYFASARNSEKIEGRESSSESEKETKTNTSKDEKNESSKKSLFSFDSDLTDKILEKYDESELTIGTVCQDNNIKLSDDSGRQMYWIYSSNGENTSDILTNGEAILLTESESSEYCCVPLSSNLTISQLKETFANNIKTSFYSNADNLNNILPDYINNYHENNEDISISEICKRSDLDDSQLFYNITLSDGSYNYYWDFVNQRITVQSEEENTNNLSLVNSNTMLSEIIDIQID